MINIETLNHMLVQKGWNQARLAAESGLPAKRISALMTGKVTRPNRNTMDGICAALGVKAEALAAEPPADTASREMPDSSRWETQLSNAARNGFGLVARRYGVDTRTIAELAPLLFVIAAERHLQGRRTSLETMEAALSEAEGHCPRHLRLFRTDTDTALDVERQAIARRDLFLDDCDDPDDVINPRYEFSEDAPFPQWCRAQLAAVGYAGDIRWWAKEFRPTIAFATEDALEIADGDAELAEAIAQGRIALYKFARQKFTVKSELLDAMRHALAERRREDEAASVLFADLERDLQKLEEPNHDDTAR